MRFSTLELLKYGHFDGYELQFPAGPQDLQILFGPNEAGKSTTMAAISDLLFGFPHSTPYDFVHDQKLLRVGARLQADGKDITVRRRKGRDKTLLDAAGNVIADGQISALLGGYSADTFQRMFSLDHVRLREGGRAILEAKDNIGQAIFAAGSGLTGIAGILEQLEAEAKEIWTRQDRGDRRYYAAKRLYDEARTRQKDAQIRPAAWEELREKIENLEATLDRLRNQRALHVQEQDKVERQRRILPHVAVLRDIEGKLAHLGAVPELPSNASLVFTEVAAALETLKVEKRLAEENRDRIRTLLESLTVDPSLIDQHDAIQALRESKGGIDKSLADLPRRHAELATRHDQITKLQHELGWPAEPLQAIIQRLPKSVHLAEMRDLLEDRRAIDALLDAACEAKNTAKTNCDRLNTELSTLPVPTDLSNLTAALKHARGLGDIEQTLALAEDDAERRAQDCAADFDQLAPWQGEAETLRRIKLPDRTEVLDAADRRTEAETALAEAKRAHQAARDLASKLELTRSQLMRDSGAVTPVALRKARDARDAVWQEIAAHVKTDKPLADPEATVAAFTQSIHTTDDLADRRFDAATQSARLTAIEEDIEQNALALHQCEDAVAAAEIRLSDVDAVWAAQLAPLGLDQNPRAFGTWLEHRQRALASAAESNRAKAVLNDLQRRRDQGKAQIANALLELGDAVTPAPSFAALFDLADRYEQAAQDAVARRRDLETKAKTAQDQLLDATSKQDAASARLTRWQDRWSVAVNATSLDLQHPPSVIRAQLALLDEMRKDVEDAQALEKRIDAMQHDIDMFTAEVAAVAVACQINPGDQTAADVLRRLIEAANDAKQAQARRDDLTQQRTRAEQAIAASETAHALALARLSPLFEAAGTDDRMALLQAIQDSDAMHRYRCDLERLTTEILTAGGGLTLEVLLAEVETSDAAALSARSTALQDELAILSDDIARVTGELAISTADFQRIDTGPDAAIAAADAEQARAEMAEQAEAYLRKRAEIMLLRWGISRYRASKQAPLLLRASSLFARLTLGRYASLLVDTDSDKARLAGVRQDNAVVPVEGMSEGTVDQLFLALRIAAVEDAVASGIKLPFLADDLFINFDDNRAEAGFAVLAELSQSTQVLFFTHHHHLVKVAERAVAPQPVATCSLGFTGPAPEINRHLTAIK